MRVQQHQQLLEDIRQCILDVPDFPEPGVLFRDITPLLADVPIMRQALQAMAELAPPGTEAIAAVEARGFVFGVPLSQILNVPFIPIRKPGKLPGPQVSVQYRLEYESDELCMHSNTVAVGTGVLLVDDLIATGGTLAAAAELVARVGSEVVGVLCLLELAALNGRGRLSDCSFRSLLQL